MSDATRLGRCLNNGRCGLADRGATIPVSPGSAFVCPECRHDLISADPKRKPTKGGAKLKRPPRLLTAAGIAVAVLAVVGVQFDLFKGFNLNDAPGVAGDGSTYLTGADATIRVGSSTATVDTLVPQLARAFLLKEGCTDVVTTQGDSAQTLQCGTAVHRKLNFTIARPQSIANTLGTATRFFDLLITTDALPGLADSRTPPVHSRVIAVDALAVIVHPKNPLARVSQEQLAAVFLGRIGDFAALGGAPGRIHVIAPAGTAIASERLNAIVPRWLPIVPTATRLASSAAIQEAVMADPLAIGVIDAGALRRAKALRIGPENGIATPLSRLGLVSGDYPLARPVTAVRFNRDDSPIETAIVDFAQAPAGRTAITAAGFEPVRVEPFKVAAPASAPPGYRALVAGADRLTAHLRFRPGSLDLDTWSGTALDNVAAALAAAGVDARRVIVIGLTDPGADPADAANLARRVATALAEHGVKVGATVDFGGALPIAAGATPEGRNHNRRVELWIRPQEPASVP